MTPNAGHFSSGCSCCTVSPPSGLFPEFSKYYSELWLCAHLWQSQSTVSSTHLTLPSLCSVASCPFHSPKFQWFSPLLAPMMSLFSTSWTGITYFIKNHLRRLQFFHHHLSRLSHGLRWHVSPCHYPLYTAFSSGPSQTCDSDGKWIVVLHMEGMHILRRL